ncbi:lipocalin family protein [Agrobacterium pusense]|uniref:lipocalin family protein n=1 Tax=Agrobacterium pusense TaxID=648995 RepID=UPI000DDE1C6A|nr:hypothetical protein [Agrobacterium sp.]
MHTGIKQLIGALTLAVALSAQSASAASPKPVPVGSDHYRGTWLEIGRMPMLLTDGCVAGYSTYRQGRAANEVLVEDGCRVDSPQGRLKTIRGVGKIEDFGSANAKMRVRYPLLITFNYWVLYKSPDKSWFISANPSTDDVWIYARSVPSKSKLQRMIAETRKLGYDVNKLEFPAQR